MTTSRISPSPPSGRCSLARIFLRRGRWVWPLTGIHDPNGMGAILFAVLAVGAQLDWEYIRDKTLEGQQIAEAKGRHSGRPKVIDDEMLTFALALRDKGVAVPTSPTSSPSRPSPTPAAIPRSPRSTGSWSTPTPQRLWPRRAGLLVASESEHYERLAGRFEENWAHSPAFTAWMTARILDRLDPRPGDRVADVGCGTGLYSRGLAEQAGAVTCIDPSAAMLRQLPVGLDLVPVHASLADLAAGAAALPYETFDVVLAKEVLHHATDQAEAVRALSGLVAPGGRLLLVLLSPVLDYPLFHAALTRYGRRSADPVGIARQLAHHGLRTEVSTASFRLAIAKDKWLAMVADRWMSLLSKFDDAELGAGIAEIDARHDGPVLEFDDTFVFIAARRPARPENGTGR